MPFSDPALTSLTATFALPTGLNGKLHSFEVDEAFRWKDSEGFADGGFQTGKITGQGVTGNVAGYINGSTVGLGTILENVTCTATAAAGRTFPMNIDIIGIKWGAKVGEMQTFAASFKSNGPYTSAV